MQSTVFNLDDTVSPDVIKALETAFHSRDRIRVWYGETDTGRAWPEEHDVTGYVGRSTGRVKIPLLVHNARSMGGPGMLEHCIVRIDTTKGRTLYRHPNFHNPTPEIIESNNARLPFAVRFGGGGIAAHFPDKHKAERYVAFMEGRRYCK